MKSRKHFFFFYQTNAKLEKILKGVLIASMICTCSCNQSSSNEAAVATSNAKISAEQNEISPDRKEAITKEISDRIDLIIKGANELNADVASQPYSNDNSFRIVNPDASVSDYQTMKNDQTAFLKTVKQMSFTTVKEDFQFLSNSLVICTWTGKNEFELKSGEKMKIDPYVGTMLFSKKNKEWKITYAHESTASPVAIK